MSQCNHASANPADNIEIPEIKVNGRRIGEQDIAQELQYHPADSAVEAIYQSAEALVIKSLLLQKAEELRVAADQQANETTEEAQIRGLLEQEINLPAANEIACRRYYEANPDRFTSPPLLEVNHILLAVAPDDIAGRRESREHAESLIQQLNEKPNLFVEFAQEFSACPSKAQGGNLGQISKGQTVAEFEKQLFRLSPGLANKPIESRYGFHVVHVAQRIDGQLIPYELCRQRIADYLADHAYVKAVGQYIDVLMSEADIQGLMNSG